MKIKPAQKKDFSKWAKMRHSLWSSTSEEEHFRKIKRDFGKSAFIAFIAEDENQGSIGFSEAAVRPFANGCKYQPVVFVEGIWVEKKWRNRGVGYSLLKAIENWAKQNNYKEIGSDCEISNTLSVKAHRSWGFKETERVIYFRKNLTN